MKTRTTEAELKLLIDQLNDLFGYPTNVYPPVIDGEVVRDEEGRVLRNKQTYNLDIGNGGVALAQGDSRTVFHRCTKRELVAQLRAMIHGIVSFQRQMESV